MTLVSTSESAYCAAAPRLGCAELGQALKWIKQREEGRGLVIKSFMDDYMKYLELAIQYGKPFLFESVEADIDPSVDPVLERSLVLQNGQKTVILCRCLPVTSICHHVQGIAVDY